MLENPCGIEGYSFLHDNYFEKHCASCHAEGGFAYPRFATQDLADAYMRIKGIDERTLTETVEDNPFCGEACSLKPGQVLYDVYHAWLSCK